MIFDDAIAMINIIFVLMLTADEYIYFIDSSAITVLAQESSDPEFDFTFSQKDAPFALYIIWFHEYSLSIIFYIHILWEHYIQICILE